MRLKKKIPAILSGLLGALLLLPVSPLLAEETAQTSPAVSESAERSPAASAAATPAATEQAASDVSTVATAATDTPLYSLQLFDEDQVLLLPRNTTSYWFRLPTAAQLGDNNILTLKITATETLLDSYSSLTLQLNGTPVSSTWIKPLLSDSAGSWTVSLPADLFRLDGSLNELQIISAQRSIEGDCADIDDPANWLTLSQDSSLSLDVLSYGQLPLNLVMNQLFDTAGLTANPAVTVVLPQDPAVSEVNALLNFNMGAGSQYTALNNLDETVLTGSLPDSSGPTVYMGQAGALSALGITVPDLAAEQGYLAVAGNAQDTSFTVSGADAAGLQKAVAFTTNGDKLAQLSGQDSVISTTLNQNTKRADAHDDGYYTLADFDYSNILLAGAFHQSTTLQLSQPESVVSGSDSYVEVHFRHSEALLADYSLMTAYINGEAITSIQLSDSNAENGTLKVKIPAAALQDNPIELKLEVYNYIGKIDCSKDYSDTAWTQINQDSLVYFADGSNALQPTLASFPSFDLPDTLQADDPQIALISTAELTASQLSSAALTAFRAGQNTGAALQWEYVNSVAEVSQKDSENLFFLTDNEAAADWPEALTAALPVVPLGNGQFSIQSGAGVTAEGLADKIVLEVIASPWNYSKKVYVVICPDRLNEQLYQLLSDRDQLAKLENQVALLDSAGQLVNVEPDVTAVSSTKVPLTPERVVDQVVRKTGFPKLALLLIGILLALLILLGIKVVRSKNRFEKAKEKMETINQEHISAEEEQDKPVTGSAVEKKDVSADSHDPDHFDLN
ncbi:cellulose biosynthesis cyclic di-GMP-binding regulatory protein BcsB [Oscillospiraceae bacterium HV4-5-C5C]|nr:cellulose biosynthesis cyclic di-GMP-binding regulatory protein BcsB [Oscillospiraceae bacterium HV4-5-C5C]